jgi:glycosyl-4,4'-diaponeurosporenoate acyltransferase
MFVRLLLRIPAFFGLVLRFGVICLVMGLLCFFIGEMLPRKNFDYRAFPYAAFQWERGGSIYLKLSINRWKDRVPDMSRYIPHTFRKKLDIMRSPDHIEGLVRETCVAELVHWVLVLLSPMFLILMPRGWNWGSMIVYNLVGNFPFIMIQRYNRPRLLVLMERQRALKAARA